MPLEPATVETRMLLSLLGFTRICVMARPVKTSLVPLELKGPEGVGLAWVAPRMIYSPTPKKLSKEKLPSPVPTKTTSWFKGSIVIAPIANDRAESIRGVHVRSEERRVGKECRSR